MKGPAHQQYFQQQQYQQQFQQYQQAYNRQYKYYQTEEGKRRISPFKKFTEVTEKTDKHFKKDGSQDFPARTCEELFRSYEFKQSGNYWIDPNEGSNKDATLVFCDKKTLTTCVYPKTTTVGEDDWEMVKKGNAYKWMAKDFLEQKEIEYAMEIPQMKMLHILSRQVRQNITFNCKNTLMKPSSLKFKFFNDKMGESGKKELALVMKTIKNECQSINDNKWHNAVIDFKSKTSVFYLPLLDISALNIGRQGEQFGFKLGPVCYM